MRDFAKTSGLHINYNKTQVVWIGGKHIVMIFTNETLGWGTKTKLFGIELTEICKIFLMWILGLSLIQMQSRSSTSIQDCELAPDCRLPLDFEWDLLKPGDWNVKRPTFNLSKCHYLLWILHKNKQNNRRKGRCSYFIILIK